MAQGRSTQMISMIECTRTSRLSIKNSLWQVRLLPLLRQIKLNRGFFWQSYLLLPWHPTRVRPAVPVPHGDEAGVAVGLAPPVGVPRGLGVVSLSWGRAERVAPPARGGMPPLTLGVLQGYLAHEKQPPRRTLQ